MTRLLKTCAIVLVTGFVLAPGTDGALAQGEAKKPAPPEKKAAPAHVMVDAANLKWGPAPPSLPAGAQAAILDGDPAKPGPFSVRVKVPDGYIVPPHWHPTIENVVVLNGTLMMGTGEKIDEASMHALTAGAYAKMPAKMRHYVRAKGETTFHIYGTGPFTINYVDPKDDPRKKTQH